MTTCPKCGMSFPYAEAHVCEGYDHTKLWWMASLAGGALGGGVLGWFFGSRYIQYIVSQACARPGAGNLCGLYSSFTAPSYITFGVGIGAAIGATLTAAVMIAVMGRRPKA